MASAIKEQVNYTISDDKLMISDVEAIAMSNDDKLYNLSTRECKVAISTITWDIDSKTNRELSIICDIVDKLYATIECNAAIIKELNVIKALV